MNLILHPITNKNYNLEIPIVDYTIEDIMSRTLLEKLESKTNTATLHNDTICINGVQNKLKHIKLNNRAANQYISKIADRNKSDSLILIRITEFQVWAIWDKNKDKLFPIYYKAKRFREDHYSEYKFFKTLRIQATDVVSQMSAIENNKDREGASQLKH